MVVSNYNKNKLVYIAVREKGYNGDKYKGYTDIKGPKAGGFVLDSESSLNISMEFTNSYGDILDKLTAGAKKAGSTSGGGILSTVKGVGEALSGGRFKLMNTNVKTWEGTSPLTIPSSLKLKFYYGIKDEYNCKTEVWDPIKELVKKFAPVEKDTNFVEFGVPTLGQAMETVLSNSIGVNLGDLFEQNQQESTSTDIDKDKKEDNSVVSESFNNVKNILNGSGNNNEDGEKSNLGKYANDFMKAVKEAYSSVDKALGLVKKESQMFQIRIGQLVFSNLYIGNVKWEFDYQQVDDKGYPYKGTVELKNISTSEYTTTQYLESVMPG